MIHTPEPQVLRQSLTVPVALDDAVRLRGQKLNWRESVVDLMKVLKTDSTYGARKQLAIRWRYSGDMADSASMNTWLRRYIITLLEMNNADLDGETLVYQLSSCPCTYVKIRSSCSAHYKSCILDPRSYVCMLNFVVSCIYLYRSIA